MTKLTENATVAAVSQLACVTRCPWFDAEIIAGAALPVDGHRAGA